MHGGTNPGAPKGNRNAWRHGGYSAETMRNVSYLKAMARFVRKIDPDGLLWGLGAIADNRQRVEKATVKQTREP